MTLQEILIKTLMTTPNNMQEKTINNKTITVFEVQNLWVIEQAIEKWIRDGIGEDLPLDQPFDEDMDTVTLASNKIFRKGANWAREEIKQRLLGDK